MLHQTVLIFHHLHHLRLLLQATPASHNNIKMFSCAFALPLALVITIIPLLATANPINAHNSTCTSGPVQCCDTTALVCQAHQDLSLLYLSVHWTHIYLTANRQAHPRVLMHLVQSMLLLKTSMLSLACNVALFQSLGLELVPAVPTRLCAARTTAMYASHHIYSLVSLHSSNSPLFLAWPCCHWLHSCSALSMGMLSQS